MFDHILYATDFSPSARHAAAAAHDLAKAFGAKVTLTTVRQPDAALTSDQLAEALLEEKQHHFKLVDAAVEVIEHGQAYRGVCGLAQRLEADLVVVGRHGSHSASEALLGSTTERIVRHAPCSVFVSHPAERQRLMTLTHVLACTDLSADAEPAVRLSAAIATHFGAGASLLHVYDLVPPMAVVNQPWDETQEHSIHALLVDKLDKQRAEVFGATPGEAVLLRDKSTVRAICDWAGDHEVELIVTGSHGRTGVTRFLLGSVAERVVRHAPCSVLVFRS